MAIQLKKILLPMSCLFFYACSGELQNGAKQALSYEAKHPVTLSKEKKSMDLSLDIKAGDLTQSQEAQIMSFIYGYDLNGVGDLLISVPDNAVNKGQTRKMVRKVSDAIVKSGIRKENISVKTHTPKDPKMANIKLTFKEITAKGPDCSDKWSENFTDAFNNTSWKGLGCSTRSNFAAMIAHPRDLIEMREISHAHSARGIGRLDSYMRGELSGVSASSTSQ